jgi:D-arabinitol dehydrogenase (NADP+)
MQAIVYTAPRAFSLADLPRPQPGPGEVVLRSTMTGVCGTDRHIHEGGFLAAYPLTPGHEILATVEELGEGVTGFAVGDQVVVDNSTACGACDPCRRGEILFCRHFRALGVNAPGGFAEYVLVRQEKCYHAGDLEPEVAVLTEPTACAMHGADVLALRPGSDVAMIGAGPTGLILAQLLLHGGAGRITMAAPTPFKLELARSFGVDRIVTVRRGEGQATARALRELAPDGYDVVIDASGAIDVIQELPALARDGGTIFVYGMADETQEVRWRPYEIFRRQLTVKGSFAQMDCFDRALGVLRSGRVQTRGIVTSRVPLARYGEALAALGKPDCLKAVIVH